MSVDYKAWAEREAKRLEREAAMPVAKKEPELLERGWAALAEREAKRLDALVADQLALQEMLA